MKGKTAVLLVLLAFVLVMAIAPGALAKSQPVAASGGWTWVGDPNGTDRPLASGNDFLKGVEIGQWTGTFTASDTSEPYVAMVNKTGLCAKLWIHFTDATVDMGGGVFLQGDMTMLVSFHAGTADAKWKIEKGTGGLQHLGGEGTLAWNLASGYMDYSGMIWLQK